MALSIKPRVRLDFAIPLSIVLITYALFAFGGLPDLDDGTHPSVLKDFRQPGVISLLSHRIICLANWAVELQDIYQA